jgi:crossover junction endodeoxyribonuclease RuvC
LINKSRVVIGIDPGTAITGYGIVREQENGELEWIAHGVVTTPSDWDEPKRLLDLYQNLSEILSIYQPDCCAVEKLFFQKNVKTAISVGQGRGAALIAAAASDADKRQVQQMVKVLLGLSDIPQPDDAADALAVAICHLHSTRRNHISNYD